MEQIVTRVALYWSQGKHWNSYFSKEILPPCTTNLFYVYFVIDLVGNSTHLFGIFAIVAYYLELSHKNSFPETCKANGGQCHRFLNSKNTNLSVYAGIY